MKAATKAAAPSLRPAPRPAKAEKPAYEAEVLPDLATTGLSTTKQNIIAGLVAEITAANATLSAAKKAKDEPSAKLKKLLQESVGDTVKVMVGEARLNYYNAPRHSLRPELLLSHGVSAATIAASTEVKDAWTLRVVAPGDKDE